MKYRMVIGILLTLLSIGTLTLVFNIQPAKSDPARALYDDTPKKISKVEGSEQEGSC